MKIRIAFLLLISLMLPGQLLAAASMSGCGARMDRAMAVQMSDHAGHVDVRHHAATPGGDCCHGGHAGGCPMASCINAMVCGFTIVHPPRSSIAPSSGATLNRYEQHVATHYRPPIFA